MGRASVDGERAASRAWAAADLRARWRSLVALGLLAGVAGGIALAAFAGARRTHTALDRLRAETNASDVILFPSQADVPDPDFAALERRPEVKAIAPWALLFGEVDGEPGEVLFGAVDGRWSNTVDAPIVVEGRMWDPDANELLIDEHLARSGDLQIGDVVDFAGYTMTQSEAEPPQGAHLQLRVVGVVRNVLQFLFVTEGQVLVSPGAVERARAIEGAAVLENANVQLERPDDLDALRRDVNELVGNGVPVLDLQAIARRIDTTTAVERSALLILGTAIAAAAIVLVGQALSRSSSVIGGDVTVLRSIGMTRRGITSAAVAPHVVAAAVGAVSAFVVAVIASRWFPVGLAARVDPERGFHVDWTVLGPGALVVFALVMIGATFVAYRATRATNERRRRSPVGITNWVRQNAPAPVGVGAAMAFEPGAGRARVPVRPALVGAVVGVLGVTATITIDRGLDDALAHPERAGVTWDAYARPADDQYTPVGITPAMEERVEATSGVDAAAVVDRELVDVDDVGVPVVGIQQLQAGDGAPIGLTTTAGRAPRTGNEAAIGPKTADELGVGIGDVVEVGAERTPVRVVGEALFQADVHAQFDQGLWLPPGAFLDIAGPARQESGRERIVAVRFVPGTDPEAGAQRLAATMGAIASEVTTAEIPEEVVNLRNVRTLPVVLAVFLGLLALAAILHVLATSARVRTRDFAILRAFGMTKRGTRTVLNSQGTAIGLVGLVVGVPLGVLAGRFAWTEVAQSVPLENVSPFALLAMLLLVPAVALVANLVAIVPGRRAARVRAAEALRTE